MTDSYKETFKKSNQTEKNDSNVVKYTNAKHNNTWHETVNYVTHILRTWNSFVSQKLLRTRFILKSQLISYSKKSHSVTSDVDSISYYV